MNWGRVGSWLGGSCLRRNDERGRRNDGGDGWWAWRDAYGEIAAASADMTVEGVERVISVNGLWGLFALYRIYPSPIRSAAS